MTGTLRPNVVIILVDQMRGDCLGALGHPDLKTPRLDRLAEEGVLFEEAYTCYPVCGPSRAALLTGRYPHANGLCGNHKALEPNPTYLGSALRDGGYETCYIGKIHTAGGTIPGFVDEAYRCGFEEFVGFNHGHDYFHSIHYRRPDEPLHDPGFQPDIQTDLALEFLERRRQRPFALMVSIGTPHWPCITPPRYRSLFRPDELTLMPGADEQAVWHQDPYGRSPLREFMAEYYRQIVNLDENVGRILDKLAERGLDDQTLVVFTADHGELFGQHGFFEKYYIHYGSTRVPLLLRWPGVLPGGRRIGALVDSSVDTMPTVLEACGIEIHPAVQGISYLSLAEGNVERTRDAVFYELIEWRNRPMMPYKPLRGVRTKEYTYVRPTPGREESDADVMHYALFDRKSDRYEMVNLVDRPGWEAISRELDSRLERHMQDTGDAWERAAGNWPAPTYMSSREGLQAAKQLVAGARPDPILERWAGRIDRRADADGSTLP